MDTKYCPTCKETKNTDLFYKNKSRKGGFDSECKVCKNLRTKKYRENNREKLRYYDKERYCENYKKRLKEDKKYREENKKKRKKYYQENKELISKKSKKYREENKELISKKSKIYHQKNKEQQNATCRKNYKENPMPYILRAIERKALKRTTSDKTITVQSVQELLENQNYKCVYCNTNLKEVEKHLDHIIPISKGGIHSITNVQWLCKDCNWEKWNHIDEKWNNKF